MGALRRALKKHSSYEGIEGLTVSMGVIFALTLPAAMALQYMSFDDGVQTKNFLLLLCTRPDFRDFVVETMSDPDTGDIGVYTSEMFNFNKSLGGGHVLDTKAVLLDASYWPEPHGDPETLYTCGAKKEVAATSHALLEDFPMQRMGVWALMNTDAPLWSDHLNAMSSFGMCILIAGLLGSLVLYISLTLSDARESSGEVLASWCKYGLPGIAFDFILLCGGIMVLLFANDAYVESQDPFALRDGRFDGYSKMALLYVFVPCFLLTIVSSVAAVVKSCKTKVADGDQVTEIKM